MAVMASKSDVIPPLEEWDINLEVSDQVYQLPKDRKQLREANLWLDNVPLLSMGGFGVRFEKSLPQVVMALYSFIPPIRANDSWPENLEHSNPSPP